MAKSEVTETNGGSLTTGQRLGRIEARLEAIEEHIEKRITRHKEANDLAIKELATGLVKDFGRRVADLEKKDVAETAKEAALEAAKKEAISNKHWVIGSALTLGILLVAVMGLLFQLLNKIS